MKINKKAVIFIIVMAIICLPLQAQVESAEDIITPTPQFQDHGGVTPWFWIGVQTVFGAGYNMETNRGGFRNYGGDNNTYASFNLAFVDSHYQSPKFYEVPKEIDPNAWTGHFVMQNFTSRINSWESGASGVENNSPAWLAEITGMGARIGFFTQAGNLVGGVAEDAGRSATSVKPIMKISGGNKVLNLNEGELGKLYYEKSNDKNSVTTYSTTSGAIMYAGYEKKELWNVYLTMLSEGNVNSGASDGEGFAGVIDFGVSPFGIFTDSENPLTFNVTGNFIGGFKFKNPPTDPKNIGFGLKADSGFWLGDNIVLSPGIAFDGKLDSNNKFSWKFGGGVIFQFSGMRWSDDEWGDLSKGTTESFYNYRYENNKVLKYAYAQVYAAYSEQTDLNLLFRVEEPDGNTGFHDKLGFLLEARLYNLTNKDKTNKPVKWETQGRVSWDLNIKSFMVTPYLRSFLNSDSVFKLRLGAYANFIPFTGFELAYTSANLNKGVDKKITIPGISSNSLYKTVFDAGRIELLVILKSDNIRPQMPKRMSDWNYPSDIQGN